MNWFGQHSAQDPSIWRTTPGCGGMILLCALLAGACATAAFAGEPESQPAVTDKNLPKTQNWFGVAVENLPAPIAKQLKLRKDQGLMVLSVLPDSPAQRAGIRAEDILIEVNDKPLTSQEELALAANLKDVNAKGEIRDHLAHLTFLREGDRASLDVMPEPRPTTMLVLGSNLRNFEASAVADASGTPQSRVRNYVLPNGGAAQVGPGYKINPRSGDPSALSIMSIRSLVSKGQTVVVTQDTDASGKSRSSITVGSTTYEVDKSKLASLPEDIRPLAEELLKTPAAPAMPTPAVAPQGKSPENLEPRIRELEVQNKALEQKLDEALKLLREKQHEKEAPAPGSESPLK